MDLTGEYTIPASRPDVWAALNDPEVLKLCISGCEILERDTDTEFTGAVTMKVGAVKARLKGKVVLSDLDPPNRYTITGHGQGGAAGFAKGGARVTLADADGAGTVLHYEAKAELGGKLAAVGSRVVQGIAKKMADDFFGKLARHFSGEEEEASAAVTAAPAPTAGVPSTAATPGAAGSELPGTVRDLIWFAVGIAVGAVVIWALYT